jgi:hypothetical protein
MKKFFSLLLATSAFLLIAPSADATLYDRGGGLIYDKDLNITWLQDANLAATETFGVFRYWPGRYTALSRTWRTYGVAYCQ